MSIQVYAHHKSGSMFLYHWFKHIEYLDSEWSVYSENNNPSNHIESPIFINKRVRVPLREEFPQAHVFDNNLKYIIQTRGILNTLISRYYSFGWIHQLIADNPIYKDSQEMRNEIQKQTLDEYCSNEGVLKEIERIFINYKSFIDTYRNFPNVLYLSYNEMYLDFPKWNHRLSKFLGLPLYLEQALKYHFLPDFQTYKISMTTDDILGGKIYNSGGVIELHRRDGRPDEWKEKLKPETVEYIRNRLSYLTDYLE